MSHHFDSPTAIPGWTPQSLPRMGQRLYAGLGFRAVRRYEEWICCDSMKSPSHRSMTTPSVGRALQINTFPSAGGSSGSGSYWMAPDSMAVSQVWHTPVRQDQRVGTSHASANSSKLP